MIVVNFFGGPGAGKSTAAAGLFYVLKERGVNCELVGEFAKSAVWEGRHYLLTDPRYQIYLFGKQSKRLNDLDRKVSVAISDSPLLLNSFYAGSSDDHLHGLVFSEWSRYHNINLFMNRKVNYEPAGRMQTEDEAKSLDEDLMAFLTRNGVGVFTGMTTKMDMLQFAANLVEETGHL